MNNNDLTMKFYVHHEGDVTGLETVTFVFELQNDNTTVVADIEEICANELQAKYSDRNLSSCFITRGKRKKRLSGSDPVVDVICAGEDLYLVSEHIPVVRHRGDDTNTEQTHAESQPSQNETTKSDAREQRNESNLNKTSVLSCGQKLEDAGHYHQAAALYEQSLQRPDSEADAYVHVYDRLVDIYMKAGRFDKALHFSEKGLKHNPTSQNLKLKYIECLINTKPKKALEVIVNYTKELRGLGTASTTLKHKLQLLMCCSYQKLDKRDMAIVLVQGILRENKNDEGALLEFANLTFDLDEEQAIQSMTILVSALVKNKDSKKVRTYLTEVCKKPRGMEYLQKVSGGAWNSIPAMILLSNVFRDQGEVELSHQLLSRAIEIKPADPNTMLSYMHLLEILNKADEVLQQMKTFCKSSVRSVVFDATASHISTIIDQIQSVVYLYKGEVSLDIPQVSAPADPYTTDDLTVLAVWFTLVKILYVQGALVLLPTLCQLLEPFFESRDLHMTDIRNEAAYFVCINKLVQGWSKTPDLNEDEQFIYIIGDSHCITPAWQTIDYCDRPATLHPVLSTGTKIWHLRPQSVFYPKTNFYNAMMVIPDGATVIFNLGEIDCRESLSQCVLKYRYDSLDEAMDHVLDIYCCLLKNLKTKHHWKIFVHPVPPVLDVTRDIVVKFNSRMRRAVQELATEEIVYMCGITEAVLTDDCTALKQQYCFDDTHLHPEYISLIQSSLSSS